MSEFYGGFYVHQNTLNFPDVLESEITFLHDKLSNWWITILPTLNVEYRNQMHIGGA